MSPRDTAPVRPDAGGRLRVALVVTRFPVLSETFVTNMAAGLVERGHQVRIHAAFPPARGPVHPIVEQMALMERVVPPRRSLRARAGGIAAAVRSSLGGAGRGPVVRSRSLRPATLWRGANIMCRLANTFLSVPAYDIVHAQFGPLGAVVQGLRELGLVRSPLVTHFRGYDVEKMPREHGGRVYERLFERGDRFLCVCELFRARLVELGCDPSRTTVYHGGVDCERFAYRERPREPGEPLRIVTVGRLVPKKGLDCAIRAMARLEAVRRPFRFDVVGDGPLRGWLRRLVDEHDLGHRVRLLGARDHAGVASILRDAHLFVATSASDAEGNQDGPLNTLKEAMGTGLPVVATRSGGIPELVEDGVHGLLAEPNDDEGVARCLAHLMDHPECWAPMTRAARARVETAFNIRTLNDELVEVYREVVAASGVGAR